jgi:hypothetical protein
MFASKTPRDLNHDPSPYLATVRYEAGQIDDEGNPVGTDPFVVRFGIEPRTQRPIEGIAETGDVQFDWRVVEFHDADPRPEFDHEQHNEPNPILTLFRDADNSDRRGLAAMWVDDIAEWNRQGEMGIDTTPDQVEHARRVLTRFANLKEGAQS